MHLYHSLPLLSLLLLIGCSKSERGTDIPEGHLELVWAVQPEETVEPWFGQITHAAVGQERIFIADNIRMTVLILHSDGSHAMSIGRQGEGPGEFTRMDGITVSPTGTVFVHGLGQLSSFSAEGGFLKKVSYLDILSGEGLGYLESPYAINDSTYIYENIPNVMGMSDVESLQIPLLISITGDVWNPIAERFISPQEAEIRKEVEKNIPLLNHIKTFTSVFKTSGYEPGQIIYVKRCEPYTVYRTDLGNQSYSFSLPIQRDQTSDLIQITSLPIDMDRDDEEQRLVGDYTLFPPPGSLPPENKMFSFTHTLRGIARIEQKLILFVEIRDELTLRAAIEERESTIQQKLFVVDLPTEKLEMVIPISVSGLPKLEGALANGALIYSVKLPYPGILAYRIVPN